MINPEKNLVGCCGIYCGLCPKFQSTAKTRCIGCKLAEMHSWCSIWSCCVKKHGFETCAECNEYPCDRFKRRWSKSPKEWEIPRENLERIKKEGINIWLEEQKEKQRLVEELLKNYNEGRSMSFYCKAYVRMSTNRINKAIKEAKKKIVIKKIDKSDIKSKAKIVKDTMKELSSESDVEID